MKYITPYQVSILPSLFPFFKHTWTWLHSAAFTTCSRSNTIRTAKVWYWIVACSEALPYPPVTGHRTSCPFRPIWPATINCKNKGWYRTRRFSNHVSRLLSRSHTFAIIVIFNTFENTSKYEDTLTLLSKNLNQRSLTPRWPLTPCLLRSHVWLYPRIIVSKSHDNTSMYVDTVINFAKYHIHTHTYIHILHTEWVIT